MYVIDGILITAVLSILAARLPYRPMVRFSRCSFPFSGLTQGVIYSN